MESWGRLSRQRGGRLACQIGRDENQWQPQELGVQPQEPPEPDSDEALAESLPENDPPLPVCAANVENWIVERLPPHFGQAALPLLAETIFS